MDQHRSVSQKKLPVATMLNSPSSENRDSAYYSGTDSKHTSTASGMGILSPPTSGFQPSPTDKTPSPTAKGNLLPPPLVSPIHGNMSVASMVSPTTPGSADPRRYDRPQSIDSAPHSATYGDMSEALSRRESVDSRINQGFHDMRLGNSHNNSPYATHNHSTTSIHNTLQQQRNPRPGLEGLLGHRISNGYQPSAERNPDIYPKTRVAPAITGPTTSQIARAAEPTKGQAWAFPQEDNDRMPSGASVSIVDSRRSSIAESIASSQYTTESRLPPGQRRLDEGMLSGGYPEHRLSSASGEFSTVHHHTLQHRQVAELRDEDGFPGGSQPYSRTPELRVSHKLAERKRRTEMKELFDGLRDLMPQERGSKASKWEILTKAIAEHKRQNQQLQQAHSENDAMRREIDSMRRDIMALRAQLSQPHRGGPVSGASQYESDPYGRSSELPPLRTLQSPAGPPPPEAMSGVQYEPRPMNGFRGPEQGRF